MSLIVRAFAAFIAAAGLVGGVLIVHPAVAGLKYSGQAIAFNEVAGTYLCVATVPTGVPGPGAFVLRAVVINASTGAVSAPIDAVASSTPLSEPALAWNLARNRYLVAYSAADAVGIKQVYGALLDPDGRPDAGAGFAISAEFESDVRRTKVAGDGADWLVVWTGTVHRVDPTVEYDLWAVLGRRVGGGSLAAGPDLASAPFEIASNDHEAIYSAVEVVFGAGPDYMVAWDFGTGGLSSPVLVEGRTVSGQGALGDLRRYGDDPNLQDGVALAAGPGGFLLGWGGRGIGHPNAYSFRVLPLDPTGAPSGTATIVRDAVATREGWFSRLDRKSLGLTWNAPSGRFFASWAELPASDPGTWWAGVAQPTPYSNATSSRLMGAVLDGTTLAVRDAGFPLLDQDLPFAQGSLLRAASNSSLDSRVVFCWRDGGVNARIHDLGGFVAPAVPAVGQYRLDGLTPLPPGAIVTQPGFVVRAAVSDANGEAVRLEVQVAETGQSLATAAIHAGDPVPSGSTASVSVALPGFALGKAYRWRARAVDVGGVASRWIAFHTDPDDADEVDLQVRATNAAPTLSGLEQTRESGALAAGLRISPEGEIVFRASSSDEDNDEIRLEVEVRRVGEAWTGTATQVGSWGTGSALAVAVAFPDADDGDAYRWRGRVTDRLGGATAWTSFGGNDDGAADFEFLARGSINSARCTGMATAGSPALVVAVAVLLVMGMGPAKGR